MRRYSPPYYSSPRRGHGRRGRSLLVRNIPRDCRPEELRGIFERFGVVRDVYIPKDYHTGEPRGFGFVQFVEPYDAMEAQHQMNGQVFAGRQMFVVVAAETRKRPEEMRHRARVRGPSDHGGRSSYSRRSRSHSFSRSPRHYHVSRSRYRSRSYSPAPQRRDYSPPERRYADHLRSPRGPPPERGGGHSCRLYSPHYGHGDDLNKNNNGFGEKLAYEFVEARAWRQSPGRPSSSPSGSRTTLADLSPRHAR
ncbi:serine/arginine-rich SC35-like splicing factor SCL30 isoform X2 [Populus nigra]|uniref:serine/arginine-rich SC35-like splicing factor SCL30 isoform X2 n=1 Tax=Populus nigra TaxID=3691 RepID=UPI002B27571F|nr:serine/arginine-rich SC35-like splicing factor SCL30 isoform X2 [Populus nigra]XP_061984941.1 serine/arginine-rich SC35-like splicing factor SCL30 isoform X2 [Populus nigra]XP_061984942.1 serine/arginine-rich SC35-like splicing factor SCL30 isoform X2 [Populus nigra]